MKILIVAPHFAPVNTPDAQRARILFPYLVDAGFDVTVLTVDSEYVEANSDPYLTTTIPNEVRIVKAKAFSPSGLLSKLGLRGLALRSIVHLYREGMNLLNKESFDVIYFSTTVYLTTLLGPYWKRVFGVPYALDYHDPWINNYYSDHGVAPPGGQIRFAFAQLLARRFEPQVVQKSSYISVVSEAYRDLLIRRYPRLAQNKIQYVPFGAPLRDFEKLNQLPLKKKPEPSSEKIQVVYTGRVGIDILPQIHTFFESVSTLSPQLLSKLQLSFWGTGYAVGDRSRDVVLPLAKQYGIKDTCYEHAERVPYFESLKLLVGANALLLFGSEEEQYSPSKLYPYLLAGKPLLIFTPRGSTLAHTLQGYGFDTDIQVNCDLLTRLLKGEQIRQELKRDIYTEEQMAQHLIDAFREVVS